MALVACAECAKEVSDKAAACPHCGAPTTASKTNDMESAPQSPPSSGRKSNIWKWLVGVPIGGFALLMIVGSCAGNTPEGRARSSQRAAIELCWQEQAKKSNDPATARFIAGTCEKMERDAAAR